MEREREKRKHEERERDVIKITMRKSDGKKELLNEQIFFFINKSFFPS